MNTEERNEEVPLEKKNPVESFDAGAESARECDTETTDAGSSPITGEDKRVDGCCPDEPENLKKQHDADQEKQDDKDDEAPPGDDEAQPETCACDSAPLTCQPVEEEETGDDSEKPTDDREKTCEEILSAIGELSSKLEELEKSLEERLKINDRERRIADEMHEELQKYRRGMYSLLMKPLIMDVIAMRESILKVMEIHLEKPEGERNISYKDFSTYADEMEGILERYGVHIYQSEPGSEFIPATHKPFKRTVTDDPAKDKRIEKSLGCGYLWDDKPVFPEKVIVFVHEAKQAPAE